MNKNLLFLILTLLLLSASGCREEKQFKIGVSQCSTDDWRAKLNSEIEREAMFHQEAVFEIRSAEDDSKKQIADIQYFLDNDFDLLVISPNEAETLTPVIKDIYEKGIPVVIFDRNVNGPYYTARIGADDKGLGIMAARYASHLKPDGVKALEVYGLRGSTPAEDRHTGFAEEMAECGGTILGSGSGFWNQENAVSVVDSLLSLFPETNVIFAHNDRMAIGASEVVRKSGRDDISIIGIDAAPEIGIKAVKEGIIAATFLYPTEGGKIVATALDILNGRPYNKEIIEPAYNAVDSSNADILLMQDESLRSETEKLAQVKRQMDDFWAEHSAQTSLFYVSLVLLALLFGVCFLLLRIFWQRRRHQTELLLKNRELQQQRDHEVELNAQLQEATQSKLAFYTNVSHDLRTPLTLIAEPVAQVADAENLTPRQQTLMKIANKNVRILQRLINQILDFRKYENNKLHLDLQSFNFADGITEWVDSFRSLSRKRHINLHLEIVPDRDYLTMADPEKVERVFFNLVSNAFKYTPDNGTITVSLDVENEKIILKVADTGEGISRRDIGNIFDRFFQVEHVHPNGSGIGLSVAKAFVELHGGTISVESEPGKGSVFTVALPFRQPVTEAVAVRKRITEDDADEELSPIESTLDFRDEKPLVLVIDDNKDIQKLVGELLSDDFNVITASDGREGVRKAVKYVPDLVICDVMMPVMDGLECCRELKSEVTTSHIPVLMLTACSLDEQKVQGYDSGADGYLSKPFSGSVLRARCNNLINNRKRIKEVWLNHLPGGVAANASEVKIAAETKVTEVKGPGSLSEIDSEFYDRFLSIFTPRMGDPDVSVDGIAAEMGLGRSQFYRKMKALTNYSPVELIKRLRLEKGRNLLLTTEKSISEIGYDIGFSTPAYFTKCYREAYGQTPSEVRGTLKK